MKNTIETAATLLRKRAKSTTDSTAFRVEVNKDGNQITLKPDMKRRTWDWYSNASSFHHCKDVVAICEALRLSFFMSSGIVRNPDGIQVPSFEVIIYS